MIYTCEMLSFSWLFKQESPDGFLRDMVIWIKGYSIFSILDYMFVNIDTPSECDLFVITASKVCLLSIRSLPNIILRAS